MVFRLDGNMTYILMIWTVVSMTGAKHYETKAYDWRPLGEFRSQTNSADQQYGKNAEQMCEQAARQLGLKTENYRCVRSR